jgi:LacI family transcriptional regulator
MKRIGIKELAKILSLNPSTVSRALADHPDIKQETKDKVRSAAIEYHYEPNLHARFFRKKTSGLIALILPDLNDFNSTELINGLRESIGTGFTLMIFVSQKSKLKEIEIIHHCLSWMVDGVIISLADSTSGIDHLKPLQSAEIPVIMVDNVFYAPEFITIHADYGKMAFAATEFLIKNDKRNLLGIFGHPSSLHTKHGMDGFKDCLETHKIPYSNYDFICPDDNFDSKLLEIKLRSTPYNGIFIMSDEWLLVTYPILVKNRQYPGQASIVAISNGKIPHQLYPKISHISHSSFKQGYEAGTILLKTIRTKIYTPEHILSEPKLIELDSVH